MKIAVNTRLLLPNKLDGIGFFTYETLQRLVHNYPTVEWHFIFDRKPAKEFTFNTNAQIHVLAPPTRHPLIWWYWFHHALPNLLNKIQPTAFLSPDGFLALNYSGGPQISVLHDINFEHQPKDLPFFYRHFYKRYFKKYAQLATRICTVSEFSKKDIASTYQINPNKIDVVYNGASTLFRPLNQEEKTEVQQEITEGKPYFIFVGSLHQRKNIIRMLLAFDSLCNKYPNQPIQLVIAGKKMWWNNDMERAFQTMNHQNRVHFTGRVSSEKLAKLVGAAQALLYPSTFEGFGIPILEGMKCKIPVLASNTTAMPEVGQDGVLYCDPFTITSILQGMEKLLYENEFTQNLAEKGFAVSQQFSWDSTADKLWQSIQKAIANA